MIGEKFNLPERVSCDLVRLAERHDKYCTLLHVLVQAENQDLDNEFIISGIIYKAFIQFELGWKLLKELLKYEGRAVAATGSPRSIIKEAYSIYDFLDADIWLEMLENRNDMAHIYDGSKARELANIIISRYVPEFQKMEHAVTDEYGSVLEKL